MADNFYKINKGLSLKNQGSTPSSLANGDFWYDSTNGFQFRDLGSTKTLGGGGSGGINFLGLSTSWALTSKDDRDAETSVGNWVTYNDSSAIPVDLTGGTASNLTLSRTTTAGEILDGSASFKIVKAAANAQGEGASCVFNVPVGYQGKLATVQFPFKVLSGTLVEGDIKCYLYDVTNSQLITPFRGDIVGSNGSLEARFYVNGPANTPANIQMRVGIHFASTSASAVTIAFDDVVVGPNVPAFAESISTAVKDSTFLTANGFGTLSGPSWTYRRSGNMLEVMGVYQTGTTSGSNASIQLPSGYAIDYSAISTETNASQVGYGVRQGTGGTVYPSSQDYEMFLFVDGTITNEVFITSAVTSGKFQKLTGSGNFNNNEWHSVKFSVPIVGWSASASVNNSTTFNVSNYLANGTRVTTTPAALGEYRSRYRSASSSNTFSDVAPTTAPSSANGMRLHPSDYSAAQTSGNISLWDIYVGKNKSVKVEYYKSAGKTGRVSTDFYIYSSDSTSVGVRQSYDPTTGVLTIDAGIASSVSETSRFLGLDNGTDGTSVVNDGYFDVIVSENVLALTNEQDDSEVWLSGGNGFGSSGTRVRRFTNSESITGSSITYADSATNGASFTINRKGLYSIFYSDLSSGGYTNHFITKNCSDLTKYAYQLTSSELVAYTAGGNGVVGSLNITVPLNVGDVIRAEAASADNTAFYNQYFRIIRVG